MFGIVIDKQGFKVEFVVLNEDKQPLYYELKQDESIVEEDWQLANSMNKPQWDGSEWIDTEPLPPQPPVEPTPSTDDKIIVLEEKVDVLETENATQNEDISSNTEMVFIALDATTELNVSNMENTEMVLISLDALTEINEQIMSLQEQILELKGVV